MKVLVTGAAGFIGSTLADRLTADGHHISGIDNLQTGRPENVGDWELTKGDISHPGFNNMAAAFQPDVIVHCAASYDDRDLWHRDTNTNTQGSINVAIAARETGARVVFFQTALPPTSSYAISKFAGQQYLQLAEVPLCVYRLANIYGPRNLSGAIPTFYKRLTEGLPVTVVNTRREMVFIDDLTDCVVKNLTAGLQGVYDVCSGSPTSIWSQYLTVVEALGLDPGDFTTEILDPPDDDVQPRVSLLNSPPNWIVHTNLQQGVQKAVDWYRAHGVERTFTHLALKG